LQIADGSVQGTGFPLAPDDRMILRIAGRQGTQLDLYSTTLRSGIYHSLIVKNNNFLEVKIVDWILKAEIFYK
jgi:hypothetical protein